MKIKFKVYFTDIEMMLLFFKKIDANGVFI